MSAKPASISTVLTPFGAYEVAIRGINDQCDERQAGIAASAGQLADAVDLIEGQRDIALKRAWTDYQAALKASN